MYKNINDNEMTAVFGGMKCACAQHMISSYSTRNDPSKDNDVYEDIYDLIDSGYLRGIVLKYIADTNSKPECQRGCDAIGLDMYNYDEISQNIPQEIDPLK